MKIFPLKPMSNYDRIANICKILNNSVARAKNVKSDIVTAESNKQLKKGRSVCNMLSE